MSVELEFELGDEELPLVLPLAEPLAELDVSAGAALLLEELLGDELGVVVELEEELLGDVEVVVSVVVVVAELAGGVVVVVALGVVVVVEVVLDLLRSQPVATAAARATTANTGMSLFMTSPVWFE